MKNLKTIVDNFGRTSIETLSYFINPLILKFKKENKQLLVFCFHGLFKSPEQRNLNHIDPQNNMTVDQFAGFIEYFLNHNYKFIQPEDLLSGLENDQRYAMITFDDGYFNNMLAIEILNKYKIPGVFFISTENVVENKSYWWDIIFKYRTQQGSSLEDIRSEQKSLKGFKYSHIDNYILKNFGMAAFTPWSDIDRPFSIYEIKELAANPYVSFGNHTHNHSILTNYSKEEIREELSVSNKILFELTGALPVTIAFPNGNHNQTVLEATREEGFQYAFTIEPGINNFPIAGNEFTCLNRYMTNTMDIKRFGSLCRLGYDPGTLYENLKIKTMRLLKLKSN